MMAELFDSEYLTQQYLKAERKIAFAEGLAKGRAEGEAEYLTEVATKLIKRENTHLRTSLILPGFLWIKSKRLPPL